MEETWRGTVRTKAHGGSSQATETSAPGGKVTFASCAGDDGPSHLRRQLEGATQREKEVEEEAPWRREARGVG